MSKGSSGSNSSGSSSSDVHFGADKVRLGSSTWKRKMSLVWEGHNRQLEKGVCAFEKELWWESSTVKNMCLELEMDFNNYQINQRQFERRTPTKACKGSCITSVRMCTRRRQITVVVQRRVFIVYYIDVVVSL